MEFRKLGKSGWEVGAVGLGAMPLSLREDRPAEEEAIDVVRAAIEAGVNLIDTADAYCRDDTETGHNERLVGKALADLSAGDREKIIVATKGGHIRPEGRWETDGRPEHLRAACEASLKNLGLEAIPLYQFHRPDPNVPLADSLGELRKLQEEGKILRVGISNVSMNEIENAEKVVDIVSVQNRFGPSHRHPETDGTLAICLARNIAFLTWGPLGGMEDAKGLGEGSPEVAEIAAAHGISPQALALAWLLSKGPNIIPIPGASRKASILDSVTAAEVKLSLEEIVRLDTCWKQ